MVAPGGDDLRANAAVLKFGEVLCSLPTAAHAGALAALPVLSPTVNAIIQTNQQAFNALLQELGTERLLERAQGFAALHSAVQKNVAAFDVVLATVGWFHGCWPAPPFPTHVATCASGWPDVSGVGSPCLPANGQCVWCVRVAVFVHVREGAPIAAAATTKPCSLPCRGVPSRVQRVRARHVPSPAPPLALGAS